VGETEEGVPFIVMEFIEGQTLGALAEKLGVVEVRRSLRIVRQIASALAEAHAVGIVHRDLKADNILLAERPRGRVTRDGDVVKVLDFGIAKLLGGDGGEIAQLTRDGTIFGTPHYIAPEQASGQDVDGRADLYSLGVILFRLVVGRLPFDGASGMQVLMRHVREEPPRPRDLRPEVPEAVEAVILTALQKQRERRFPDAEHFIAAIEAAEQRLGEEGGRTLLGLHAHVGGAADDPRGTTRLSAVAAAAGRAAPGADGRGALAVKPVAGDDLAGPSGLRGPGQSGEVGLEAWSRTPLPSETGALRDGETRRRQRWAWLAVGGVTLSALVLASAAIVRLERAGPPPVAVETEPAMEASPARATPPAVPPAVPAPPLPPTPDTATAAPGPEPGGAPLGARQAPPVTPARHRPAAARSPAGGPGDLPVTLVPSTTTPAAPIVPHALGPAPEASGAAEPPSAPPPSAPPPPSATPAPPPVRRHQPPAPTDDADPYQMLREAK